MKTPREVSIFWHLVAMSKHWDSQTKRCRQLIPINDVLITEDDQESTLLHAAGCFARRMDMKVIIGLGLEDMRTQPDDKVDKAEVIRLIHLWEKLVSSADGLVRKDLRADVNAQRLSSSYV